MCVGCMVVCVQPSAHRGVEIKCEWLMHCQVRVKHTDTQTHPMIYTLACTHSQFEAVLRQTDRGCLRRCVASLRPAVTHTFALTLSLSYTHTVKVKVGDGCDSVVGLWFRLASSCLYFCLSLSPRCS